MKTYLPQIERRILVRPNQTFGILNYDMDNAYPQRMLELVAGSPTAKDCWNKRAKFIAGNGFEQPDLGKQVINANGLTLTKLLKAVATDKALFTGFGFHINYNANFKISSINYIKFEDIRIGDTDCDDTTGKFAIYSDWGRKTWKNIMRSKITFLDAYDPDTEAIKQQVINTGGWENYKGQLLYCNPEINDYPLIEGDSVWEDFETEAGIALPNSLKYLLRDVITFALIPYLQITGFLYATEIIIPWTYIMQQALVKLVLFLDLLALTLVR